MMCSLIYKYSSEWVDTYSESPSPFLGLVGREPVLLAIWYEKMSQILVDFFYYLSSDSDLSSNYLQIHENQLNSQNIDRKQLQNQIVWRAITQMAYH